MKNRILTFIIGTLIGAIMATTGFLIYSKSINKNMINQFERLPMKERQQMQPQDWDKGEILAKPEEK